MSYIYSRLYKLAAYKILYAYYNTRSQSIILMMGSVFKQLPTWHSYYNRIAKVSISSHHRKLIFMSPRELELTDTDTLELILNGQN